MSSTRATSTTRSPC
jgi:hypothetical protein